MKTKSILTLAFFAAATLFAAEPAKVGTQAPAFSLTDAKGKAHSLADYKGKTVVLEWFNPECPFVKKHYGSGHMQQLQQEYAGKGVVWLSIDSSAAGKEGHLTPEAATKQMSDWKMDHTTLLLDSDGKVGQAYGAKNTPHMFIIGADGNLIYQGAIDSKASPNPADLAGATNYVKVALDETLAGKAVTTATTKPYGCAVKY
ncbi:MAG: thioredoxin family protein [Verrucomicrobiota bacterium]|nr:thioredoxin family protein [Verrucomicrobiota bacterium]